LDASRRDEIVRKAVAHVLHWPMAAAEDVDPSPQILTEGAGALIRDIDGREYIDGNAILGVTQIGHGRADMADAIAAQVRKLEYASLANGFSNAPAAELAFRLAQIAPGDLSVSYFSTSGSEAVDTALKMARHYHRQRGATGRTKLVARHGSYHGLTFGAMSVCGLEAWREPFAPLVSDCLWVPAPYPYRSEELGCAPEETGRRAAEALEAAILAEGPETVAAVIAEAVPVPFAVRVPPDDYWPAVRAICDRHGVLLIVDEILTGFGRTGRMFACEHWGLEPDIMVVAKGITSGYVPLSATIVTSAVAETFWGEHGVEFMHASTYAGHPVACAAALENLDIFEREALVERGARLGERMLAGLRELEGAPFVGNVSGVGLLASVELVTDRAAKTVAPPEVGGFVARRMAELGVLVRYMPNGVYFYPPLVIEPEQVDRMVAATAQALVEAEAAFAAALVAS
jgi:adenosylmethionine-8-amino-7-oxononanoate aminotransferase